MHYFLYSTDDTFITNQPNLSLKNSGLDEVLEVEKTIQPTSCVGGLGPVLSRTLIRFDLTAVAAAIAAGEVISPKFFLNLKCTEAIEVPLQYTIAAYPINVAWVAGTGYKFDGRVDSDGASWKFSDGNVTKWWPTSSLLDCSGGGTWLSDVGVVHSGSAFGSTGALVSTQSFKYQTADVRMDITNIASAWLTGSIQNNGLILMHGGDADQIHYGKLRFFSKESNTIYQPYVDVAWDDSTFSTASIDGSGSLGELSIRDAVVSLPRLRREYRSADVVRIDVAGRDRYPQKTFTNRLSDYMEPSYLPRESYYSVLDAESNAVVIPVDSFTKLSCDANGNFFNLDMSGLPQERYYQISIRCEQSGSISNFVSSLTFKVTR